MTARLTPKSPAEVAGLMAAGRAVLVDIREPDEFAGRHVAGALSRPLSAFDPARLDVGPGRSVVFTCRSGMRTAMHCDRLAAAVEGEAFVLDGGVDGWAAAGLPTQAG